MNIDVLNKLLNNFLKKYKLDCILKEITTQEMNNYNLFVDNNTLYCDSKKMI